jgi:hypothetical protein
MEDQMSSTRASDEAAPRPRHAGIRISPGLKDVWRRGQRGWPARHPVVQFPNPPLIVAATGFLLAVVTTGSVADYGRATFYAGLAVWAWLELTDGANRLRRVLGAAGLVLVVVKVGEALGG